MLFIVEGNFTRPIEKGPAFGALLQGHFAFTRKNIEAGRILFAGPKPTGGGYFLIKAESLEAAKEMFKGDPFCTEGINDYTFTEFTMHDCADCVKEWFSREL